MDDTTDLTHVEETHMTDALNKLANAVTSNTTNLTNLIMKNIKLAEQLKAELAQNKVLTYLLNKKIFGVTATQSENNNSNKRQRTDKIWGCDNHTSTEGKWYYLIGYFWTHIYKVDVVHNSWTCLTSLKK